MRVLLRILAGLLGLAAIAVLAVFLVVFFTTRPRLSGTVHVRGLTGPVSITRDQHGVPHIHATATDADAFFALGFVHAQDRLWQMDFQRRIGQGRLSEVLGPAALDNDKFLRTWGFSRAAENALPALSARTRGLLAAYTAGVNAGIHEGKLPLEFRILRYRPEPWTDADSLVWAKLMAFDLGGNWEQELTAQSLNEKVGPRELGILYPGYPKNAPTILNDRSLQRGRSVLAPGGQGVTLHEDTRAALAAQVRIIERLGFGAMPDKGSNNWVVSGRLTQSGKPILADDPHLKLQAPMLWYLAELKGPTLHVIGATIPGLPGVVIGRNDRVAWGVTNTNPDVQDLYVEPENAPLTARTEIIKVKGQSDVKLTVHESRHGPIITGVGGVTRQRVALKWTALQPGDTTLDAYVGLNYARNWRDFTTALRSYVAPVQNFVYADTDGNIGYYAPGRIPIRNGWNGMLPVPGDGTREWTGFIPFEDLPHTFNPPEGMIVTANNKVAPDSYPYLLNNNANWATPYRAERITQLLKAKQKLTPQDMARIQADTKSLLWEDLKPFLLRTQPDGEASRAALSVLQTWDGHHTRESIGGSIFAAWYTQLTTMTADELGQEWNQPLFIKQQLTTNGTYCRDATRGHQDCAAFLTATLKAATNDLTRRLGRDIDGWRWERLHATKSDHGALGGVRALNWIWNRSTPSDGGLYTVNPGSYELHTYRQTNGPSYRQIVDLDNPDASRYVGTLGQSGNPLSAHYSDQEPLWRDGQYLRMTTDPEDWGATSVLHLRP